MPSISEHVNSETLIQVDISYLDRKRAKWWNERRDTDEPIVFCGWYWTKALQEGGPFKTRSAAVADAYYRFVLRRDKPTVSMKPRKPRLVEHRRAA